MSRRHAEKSTVTLYRGDDEVELPGRFAVCPSCDGRGVTTLHGIAITGDEWAEWDPDERDGYFRGDYDTPCPECHGRRVVTVVDEERCDLADLAAYRAQLEDDAEMRAIEAAERRMGA